MKLEGFKLHSIYLDTEIESFDLHNCFNFVGLDYDISSRTLRLRWTPSSYAPLGERRTITVIFQQVTHFSAEPRDPATPFTEDDCLESICFAQPDSPTASCFEAQSAPTADVHYVFSFMSGFSFRVSADTAQYKIR